GVEYGLVYDNVFRRATGRDTRKNALYELGSRGIIWEIHAVQQVCPVPAVRDHGIGPSRASQVIPCPTRYCNRAAMFLIGRTDARRPGRIKVDQQPSAPAYVVV